MVSVKQCNGQGDLGSCNPVEQKPNKMGHKIYLPIGVKQSMCLSAAVCIDMIGWVVV